MPSTLKEASIPRLLSLISTFYIKTVLTETMSWLLSGVQEQGQRRVAGTAVVRDGGQAGWVGSLRRWASPLISEPSLSSDFPKLEGALWEAQIVRSGWPRGNPGVCLAQSQSYRPTVTKFQLESKPHRELVKHSHRRALRGLPGGGRDQNPWFWDSSAFWMILSGASLPVT